MWKTVLADYIQNLKPQNVWHKLKNCPDNRWVGIMFLPIAWIWLISFDTEEVYMNSYIYISFMLVALLGLILSIICENRLKGVMFLCPLSREDRIQYIKCGYRLRVGVLFLPYTLSNLILCILGYMNPASMLTLAAIVLLYLLGVNSSVAGRREGIHMWFMISGYIEFFIFYMLYQDGGMKFDAQSVGFWICVFIYGTLGLLYLIPLLWKTKAEYVKMVIECADFDKETQV